MAALDCWAVGVVWNTAGEVAATLAGAICILGNFIVLSSVVFRSRALTATLLILLGVVSLPLPLFLHVRMTLIEIEVDRIIAHAESAKTATGSYPDSLAAYTFRRRWAGAFLSYEPGFRVNWWGVQPGVSHWYTPTGGYGYYPD